MADWGALKHPYGPADDVLGLLDTVARDPGNREAWDDLWSRLYHPGTVYSASSEALPELARLALEAEPAGYQEPLQLAASVVASTDRPDGTDVMALNPDVVAALRDRAERNLALSTDDTDFVYGLQALMAFEGVHPWSSRLELPRQR